MSCPFVISLPWMIHDPKHLPLICLINGAVKACKLKNGKMPIFGNGGGPKMMKTMPLKKKNETFNSNLKPIPDDAALQVRDQQKWQSGKHTAYLSFRGFILLIFFSLVSFTCPQNFVCSYEYFWWFQVKRDRHRGRQKYFYRACLLALKKANRTRVASHDSDEFVVYNHAGGDAFEAWEAQRQQLHDQSAHARSEQRIRHDPPIHHPPRPNKVPWLIAFATNKRPVSNTTNCPVLVFLVSNLEQKNLQKGNNPIMSRMDSIHNNFDTLKWRKHAARNDFVKNALGKVIMDMSWVDIEKSPHFMSLHWPIKKIVPLLGTMNGILDCASTTTWDHGSTTLFELWDELGRFGGLCAAGFGFGFQGDSPAQVVLVHSLSTNHHHWRTTFRGRPSWWW